MGLDILRYGRTAVEERVDHAQKIKVWVRARLDLLDRLEQVVGAL
jgi:hypothetical protein